MTKIIIILQLIILTWGFGSWGVNLYKLTQLDWESPYKAEVIHSIAVPVVPISIVTCWLNLEEE